MAPGRRSVSLADPSAWVFNRIADVYDARPAYPLALVDAVAALGVPGTTRIGDLGAGIGHLALPLAARGFDVTAVEPAQAMLDRLRQGAERFGVSVRTLATTAEALPVERASLDLVVIADALHFLDAERSALEIARVLVPEGAIALVTCEFADTPFMRDIVRLMYDAAPRRPRDTSGAATQLAALTGARLTREQRFHDETLLDEDALERILRSFSFIGPAMNRQRFAGFWQRVQALPGPRIWARAFTLRSGARRA